MFTKTLAMASILGLALSASQPAFANSRVVSYADLDLGTSQGQAELNKRLRTAAKQVCGLKTPDLNRAEYAAAVRCFQKSYAKAQNAQTGAIQIASAAAR